MVSSREIDFTFKLNRYKILQLEQNRRLNQSTILLQISRNSRSPLWNSLFFKFFPLLYNHFVLVLEVFQVIISIIIKQFLHVLNEKKGGKKKNSKPFLEFYAILTVLQETIKGQFEGHQPYLWPFIISNGPTLKLTEEKLSTNFIKTNLL